LCLCLTSFFSEGTNGDRLTDTEGGGKEEEETQRKANAAVANYTAINAAKGEVEGEQW
jgi:hypothetical protein